MLLLVSKNREVEGFYLDDSLESTKRDKSFIDSRHKILLDNTAPYGHFITSWLYFLLKSLEDPALTPENTLVLMYLSPDNSDLRLEHMSTITTFTADKLRKRGYQVEYIEAEEFYVSNLYGPLLAPHVQDILLPYVVGPFLAEDVSLTLTPTRKIYLSRSKTTTSNSRHLGRIDDEHQLELYLQTLGFEVLVPEDFNSYQDQLTEISSAKVLVSLTSSALYSALVLSPESTIVEICTRPRQDSDRFPDHYRSIALIQGNSYIPIPNLTLKAQDIVDYIESKPEIKSQLS